jgi:aminoglycoside 2''-phosphotransferase
VEGDDTDRLAVYLQRIRASYSDLEAKTTRLVDAGEFNDILIINEQIIFRFPTSPDGMWRLKVEVAVLGAMQEYISVPIPNPIYVSEDMETVGVAFMGYRMVPGEPLMNHLETLRAKGGHRQLAGQLAAFLRELHTFPVKSAGLEVPAHDRGRREALPELYQSFREHLYPHMRADARDLVTHQFDTFLSNPASFDYEQVLRHGDLGPGNILLDPQRGTISGIIDFGSAGLDDPATDLGFVSFWGASLLGRPFVEQLHSDYPVTESLLSRIRFFEVMIAMMIALEGLQRGERETFEMGLGQFM